MSDLQQIYVVHEDLSVRRALGMLLSAAHFSVQTFNTASDFLAEPGHKQDCLIIDVRTPGINWLEFQIEIAKQAHDLIILVISTESDLPTIIGAMSAGAIDFIEKPFDGEHVLVCVRRALAIKAKTHDVEAERGAAQREIARLTKREKAVAEQLASGKSNKLVALELGISPRTVEIHRARILHKLKIANVSNLTRLWHQAAASATVPDAATDLFPGLAHAATSSEPGDPVRRRQNYRYLPFRSRRDLSN